MESPVPCFKGNENMPVKDFCGNLLAGREGALFLSLNGDRVYEVRGNHIYDKNGGCKVAVTTHDDVVVNFCASCRNKKVNGHETVEDLIKKALQRGEADNKMGGYLLLQGVIVELEKEGGCQRCIYTLQRICDMLAGE